MLRSTDHLVRSVFHSLGLQGPVTREQQRFGLFANPELYEHRDDEQLFESLVARGASTQLHRGQEIRLLAGATAFPVEEKSSFDSLGEVLELATMMAALVPLEIRVRCFLNMRPGAHDGSMLAYRDDRAVEVSTDPSLSAPHELKTSRTRRGTTVLDAVVIGPEFSWAEFTHGFDLMGEFATLSPQAREQLERGSGSTTQDSFLSELFSA